MNLPAVLKQSKKIYMMLFFLFVSQTSLAWNAIGHMVVANIAYQNLNANTRDKVDHLLAVFKKEYPEINNFDELAPWADSLHGQKIETFSRWHYIDVAFSNDGSSLKNLVDSDNIVWALENIIVVVKNRNANDYEKARFLAFLIHFMGDVHQPLHTVSYISYKHPDGDKGGNAFTVQYKGNAINLHKLWDGGLDIFTGDESSTAINRLAESLVNKYPKAYFGDRIKDLNANNWAQEGLNVAKQFVYDTSEYKSVSPQYVDEGRTVSEKEVTLAGYRLAEVLNQAL